MNRKVPQLAIWLMWLALPLTAGSYWQVWDRQPMRMAVHFDANWQPSGWTTREASLELALAITAFMVVVFTVGGYVVRAAKPALTAWVLLGFFYVVIGFVCAVNRWVVEYNLSAQAQHSWNHHRDTGSRAPGILRTES